jgi:DNA-binding transcriptional ArsR family regulator
MVTRRRLDATFAALSDPIRRALLERLRRGESSVSSLAKPFRISLPAISRHLRVLEGAGLIRRKVRGRVHSISLKAAPLARAIEWLGRYHGFWGKQLDSLGRFLRAERRPRRETARRSDDPGVRRRAGARLRRVDRPRHA